MAHGYYRTCGKPAAVMVHVTVGTANSINGLINASRDNIPLLLAAGRTPITERGHVSSRNRSIHWGQESFDQGGMVREYVKWDYELRSGQPVDAVVDRALDIAMSEPRGPVYLTLPREVLTDAPVAQRRDTVRPLGTPAPEPPWAAIEEAAALIAKAEFPLIVTSSVGRNPAAIDELAALAEEFALPVVQAEARDFNLPVNHSMHVGFEPAPFLAKADLVIETVKTHTPVHPVWLAHCINQVKSEDAIVVSELGVPVAQLELTKPRSYMGSLLSGGLGFGMGAALGAKLAAPGREVIVAVGDGSYMFGNPIPYHYVARAENLPTLTIVSNNHMWGAVRQATLDVFPEGAAAKANAMPITELKPSPDYEKVIATCGGRGERVDSPADLLPALQRSMAAVREGTPAMLNVMTQGRR